MSARPLPVQRPASDGTPRLSRVAGAKATGVREELEELQTLGALRLWVRNLFHESPSWLTSMVAHMILLLVLALLTLPSGVTAEPSSLLLSKAEEIPLDEIPPLPPEVLVPTTDVVFESFEPVTETTDFDALYEGPEEFVGPEIEPVRGIQSLIGLSEGDIMTRISGGPGDLSRGRLRGFELRRHTVEGKAVSAALKWLAEHQLPDGSWSFDHTRCPACGGQCRHAGNLADARLGATALALLPFLGAGQTHREGPASGDMYYNYYATQVLRHYGGEPWRQWDAVMRQQLIDAQATAGHEAGSWYFPHTHADRGGRLYCTAMATMTLEVYYRHLPLYEARSVEDGFIE